MKHRHLARQAALQILASLLLNPIEPKEVIGFVHKEFAPRLKKADFLESIVFGVLKHQEELDKRIAHFAPSWPIEKLDPVERSILEMGCFEICQSDTPAPVIINEAVDLAKEFGDDTAGKFINGVLSSIARDHGKISQK